jgi:hypothetical protein
MLKYIRSLGAISKIITLLFTVNVCFIGCKSSSPAINAPEKNELSKGHGPRRIYVPEYFVYRRGKYQFVKGHYHWVLFPKNYQKRAMRGYTIKQETAANKH